MTVGNRIEFDEYVNVLSHVQHIIGASSLDPYPKLVVYHQAADLFMEAEQASMHNDGVGVELQYSYGGTLVKW